MNSFGLLYKITDMSATTKTLKVRIKDKHAGVLREMARSVNTVWNYINELSERSIRERHKFLSAFDIHAYTTGASKELGLHSQTVQCIAKEYVTRRVQFKKRKLNWRVSNPKSPKRSLGWIPVNTGAASYKSGQIYHHGHHFGMWDSFGLGAYKFRTGSFNEDSRGRWYFNVVVEVPEMCGPKLPVRSAAGIDLGLKEAAVASTGERIEGRFYRALEQKLGIAQRAKNKKRARAIHAKIGNQRKDLLHKFSSALVKNNAAIFVGGVASAKLVKTKMAKSVLDAGWSSLKTMLEYKSHQAGIVYEEVQEAYTTQTCSCCGQIGPSSPKGRTGLGIREWACSHCSAVHDRDVNAARNILALGLQRLAGGIHAQA